MLRLLLALLVFTTAAPLVTAQQSAVTLYDEGLALGTNGQFGEASDSFASALAVATPKLPEAQICLDICRLALRGTIDSTLAQAVFTSFGVLRKGGCCQAVRLLERKTPKGANPTVSCAIGYMYVSWVMFAPQWDCLVSSDGVNYTLMNVGSSKERKAELCSGAIEALRKAVSADSTSAVAYRTLGVAYILKEDYVKARAACNKAVSLGFPCSDKALEVIERHGP